MVDHKVDFNFKVDRLYEVAKSTKSVIAATSGIENGIEIEIGIEVRF